MKQHYPGLRTRIRFLRERLKLSQLSAALEAGISQADWAAVESTERATVATLERVARALQVETAVLTSLTQERAGE